MFHTDMERLTSFQTIRTSGKLPDEVYTNYPEYVDVLKNMLNEDSQKRPTAHELLNLPIFSNQSKRELLNIIDDKEKLMAMVAEMYPELPERKPKKSNKKPEPAK